MFQNHLLQLVTLTAMEAPVGFNADAVRDEKVKVLKALRPLKGKDAIQNTYRAQYVSGTIEGKRVPGYKDEAGVPPDSVTETLLAARLYVDNWRWAGVPFYVRSGKRLPSRLTEIVIRFRQAPLSLFDWHNLAGDAPNTLVLSLQPDEGIRLEFGAKARGLSIKLRLSIWNSIIRKLLVRSRLKPMSDYCWIVFKEMRLSLLVRMRCSVSGIYFQYFRSVAAISGTKFARL